MLQIKVYLHRDKTWQPRPLPGMRLSQTLAAAIGQTPRKVAPAWFRASSTSENDRIPKCTYIYE